MITRTDLLWDLELEQRWLLWGNQMDRQTGHRHHPGDCTSQWSGDGTDLKEVQKEDFEQIVRVGKVVMMLEIQ